VSRGRKKAVQRALALHYGGERAPRITASGSGLIAERILEIAREHGVPVHEDPLLTAALAQVPVGDEIPETLYAAVAEVLAFVYFLSGREPGHRP
jgi:flagellar biosynthesis protein